MPRPRWLASERLVLGIFVTALLVLVAVAYVTDRTTTELINSAELVEHTHQVRSELFNLLASAKEAESAVRGYVITGQPEYLQGYEHGKSVSLAVLTRLTEETKDNPGQRKNVDEMRPMLAQRFALLEQVTTARKNGGLEAATKVRPGVGQVLSTRITNLVGRMDTEERDLLDRRREANIALQQRTRVIDLIGLLLAAVMTILAIGKTLRDESRRREVERMKDEFISVVSHELRTPLTAIRGSLGILNSGKIPVDQPQGKRMLEIAVSSTDRLVRLINDILDIERMESGQLEMKKVNCDVAETLQAASEIIQPIAERSNVRIEAEAKASKVLADPDRLVQMLTNLLGNAIKFSPEGSVVKLAAEQLDGNVVFTVTDHGRGIPPEKREMIFERFKQVDTSDARDKGGVGLGLAICRSIVAQHGGRIWVEDGKPSGSVFKFTIPLVEQKSAGA